MLGVDLRIDVIGLGPVGVGWIEEFEIRHQVGAVENTAAQIASERSQPCAAERAAQVAHRILASDPGPVGKRRAGEHDRTRQIRADRRHHHDLPASLAIGDDDRLSLGLRMPRSDFLDKDRFGAADVLDRLPGHRRGREADEVAGMAGGERHPDLAVRLHASDARPVAGARIDDDDRRLCAIDRRAGGRNDAHEPVVDRRLQSAAVPHQLCGKIEHVRNLLRGVLAIIVASFTEGIQNQYAALPRVNPVFLRCAEAGHLLRHRSPPHVFETRAGRGTELLFSRTDAYP